jgi:hypothetical protein
MRTLDYLRHTGSPAAVCCPTHNYDSTSRSYGMQVVRRRRAREDRTFSAFRRQILNAFLNACCGPRTTSGRRFIQYSIVSPASEPVVAVAQASTTILDRDLPSGCRRAHCICAMASYDAVRPWPFTRRRGLNRQHAHAILPRKDKLTGRFQHAWPSARDPPDTENQTARRIVVVDILGSGMPATMRFA